MLKKLLKQDKKARARSWDNIYDKALSKLVESPKKIESERSKDAKQHEFQRKYFDYEFRKYKKYKLDNWQISYLKRIFKALGIDDNPKNLYLDIGVGGTGYTVIEIAKKGCRSVGIDLSLEGIKKARSFAKSELKRKASLCNFVVCLGENLPFKENIFNKLSSIAVLEHVPNDKKAIEEIARVTKSDGKIWITVPNTYTRISPIFWIPYYIHDKRIGHLRHYKAENLIEKFANFNFMCEEVQYTGHLPKIFQILFSYILKNRWKNSKMWWKIENMDLKKKNNRSGLQLSLIFSKM